jgi:hypothetical protein
MTGDVVWTSASFDGSGNVTGTAAIQPDSVVLGTDSTGNYVGTITGGTGITSTGGTTGEGVSHSLSVDAAQSQITTVGTIGAGVWEGTTVAVAQGGTGATSFTNLFALGTHTTGNYMTDVSAGTLVDVSHTPGEGSTATVNVDLTEAAEAAIANGDYLLFLDGGATGTHAKEAVHDLATLFAGTGLTASSSVIGVDASQTQITAVGDLGTGSITSGFTSIDVGSGTIATTGVITAGGLTIGSAAILEAELEILDGATITTAELNLLDGGTSVGGSITLADTDGFIVHDGGVMKTIPASDLGVYITAEGSMSNWVLEDGDGTEVTVTNTKEIKFVEGGGLDINWTDTDNGTDADPYDLTFTIDAAQTLITSIYATDLIMGEDTQTAIDFGTANEIDFKVDNAARLTMTSGALYPVTNNQIDLGTSTLEFKDAFFDGTVTADAFAGPLTGAVTGNADTVTTNANLTGHITSTGNAALLGSFSQAQLMTALTDETIVVDADIGSTVQAYDADLLALAGIGTAVQGDIIYSDSNGSWARLVEGADGYVLTLASGVPSWAVAASGDITGITTGDGLSGGATSGTPTLVVDLVSNGGLEFSSGELQVATGISQYDVAQFAASVADDDFLRISGTAVEGLSVSEVAAAIESSIDAVGTIATGTWAATDVAVLHGGTGESTATAGFDALSPMSAEGDVIYGGTSGTVTRLAKGTDNQTLMMNGNVPNWETVTVGATAGFSVAMAIAL